MTMRSLAVGVVLAACVFLAAAGCTAEERSPREAPVPPPPSAPPPKPAPPATTAQLVEGALPAGPEAELLQQRCTICHTTDYVVQQRLTEAQWRKTLAKMQKWGAPLTDDEAGPLSVWLARTWPTTLPERVAARVPPPPGALP